MTTFAKQKVEPKQRPVEYTKSEYHNNQVMKGNKGFADKLKTKAKQTGGFEESESSYESDKNQPSHSKRGELMVINVDLGKKGFVVLNGFSNQSAQ